MARPFFFEPVYCTQGKIAREQLKKWDANRGKAALLYKPSWKFHRLFYTSMVKYNDCKGLSGPNRGDVMMNCPNCATEMNGNYIFRLGFSGAIKVEKKRKIEWASPLPEVSVCPDCGKVEIYVDLEAMDDDE